MRQHRALQLGAVLLAVALLPALFAGGVAADGPGEDSSTAAQPLIVDGIIDSLLSEVDDADEAEGDGGLLDSVFGESFDGYPDGFSEDGIDDFEQALGEDSVHYQADSLSIDVAATTPEGEFEATLSVSAAEEEVLIEAQNPDGERSQYFDGETSYINEAGEYSQSSDTFDREELYMVSELERDLSGVNLTQEAIDGDTVVYTAEDRDIELAVRDTGELDYVEIDDEESVFVDFHSYDATTVAEPAWVAEAEDVAEEPDRDVPDDVGHDGEIRIVEETDDGERVRTVDPDADRDPGDREIANDERLRERAEEIEDRIAFIEEQIEEAEDSEDEPRDHEDRIADLEDRIDRHQDRIADMEAEIAEIEAGEREAELREEIAALEAEREALEADRDELRDQYAEADDEEREQQLREEINQVLGEIGTVNSEIDRAERQLDSLDPDAEIAQRENRIESSEERIADLRERINQLEDSDRTTDSDRVDRLEDHKAELEEELEEIEDRLDE